MTILRGSTSLEKKKIKDILKNENPILAEQTNRAQILEQVDILTKVIVKYATNKEMKDFVNRVNSNLSEFSDNELYEYYSFLWDFRYEIQVDRVLTITIAVAESFKPVLEFALLEVGGGLAIKLLGKLPAVIKTVQITQVLNNLRITNSLSKFKHAQKFGIKTYAQHVKYFDDLKIKRSELGVEIHHLIEQRFANTLSVSPSKMKSIVLTKSEHKLFSDAWLAKIPKSNSLSNLPNTLTATKQQINDAARIIYKDYPDILNALGL